MNQYKTGGWIPGRTTTSNGGERRVGIEIELAGVTPEVMARLIKSLYGGKIVENTRFDFNVTGTCFGKFKLELDSSYLAKLAEKEAKQKNNPGKIAAMTADFLARTSELVVPWEIVTPPIKISELEQLCKLVDNLRKKGALGTRYAPHFAFGVHFNPELPDLETSTIVNYLRAYFCLHDWIAAREKVDLSRKITPFMDHFDKDYIKQVIDPEYQPSQQQLIDDYLAMNPTRNRSLDMLPLLACLDEDRVREVVDDERVQKRPAFHYRLPNCDIDNPDWNLDHAWNSWLEVERLSNDKERLRMICEEYGEAMERLIPVSARTWCKRIGELLSENTSA